ncbi:hypothetical protein EJ641_17810, partial [Pseudomonas aeruginosa]
QPPPPPAPLKGLPAPPPPPGLSAPVGAGGGGRRGAPIRIQARKRRPTASGQESASPSRFRCGREGCFFEKWR